MNEPQMSSTAVVIAASTALAAREPTLARLLDEDDAVLADAVLAEAGPRGRLFVTLLASRVFRASLIQAEGLLLPGIQLHYRARKRRIAALVHREIACGAAQVVIAGSGYDGLGARLARRHPEARVFELDHSGVVALKRRALQRAGIVRRNLHHVSADLATASLAGILASHPAFVSRDQTVVVAEGLLMYFGEAEVRVFLTAARDVAHNGGKVIFTALDAPSGTRPCFRREHPLVAWWLARSAEPFRWSVSPAELAGFVATLGLVPAAVHARDALVTELGASGDETMLAEGEYVVVAEPQARNGDWD